MEDLIRRKDVLNALDVGLADAPLYIQATAMHCVTEAPAAAVSERRKHGTWKNVFRFAPYQVCSACGFEMPMVAGENVEEIRLYRYCPDCGARMDGGDGDERPAKEHRCSDA